MILVSNQETDIFLELQEKDFKKVKLTGVVVLHALIHTHSHTGLTSASILISIQIYYYYNW